VTVTRSSTPASAGPESSSRRWLGFTHREHLAALTIFAAVTFGFFFPVVQGDTFSDVERRQRYTYPWRGLEEDLGPLPVHYDQDDSFYPWQVFMSRELRQGEFPLWNPYNFGGAPFFANGQSGVLYPPRLALSLLVSPTRVHDLLLATHFFFAGVAMFLLLGFVRLSFPSALVGGLAWMLNSFALSWQALEHYVAIGVWLPVGVLLAHAVVRRRSWAASFALALVLGLLFTGGNVLFVELAVTAIFGYAVALAIADARLDRRALGGSAARLGTAAGLFAGLTAVSALPILALAGQSARVSLSYDEIGGFALPWDGLVNIFRLPPVWLGEPYHVNLFAGTAVGLLAVVGLRSREGLARFAIVLGTLTILFMLHTPVTFVVNHLLPGFGNFKPLARAAFLLQFALVVLAAFGLEAVRRWLATREGLRLTRSQFFAGALAGAIVGGLMMRFGRPLLGGSSIFVLALALVLTVAAALTLEVVGSRRDALAHLWRRVYARFPIRTSSTSTVLAVVVAVSIVVQARVLATHVMLHQPDQPRSLYPATPLIRYLEGRPEARFLPTDHSFRGSTAMIYRLQSAGGYESLLPGRVQNFWRVVGDNLRPEDLADNPLIYAYHPEFDLSKLRPELLARAGVDYVVIPPSEQPGAPPPGYRLVYSGLDGSVLQVDNALPKSYLVSGCRPVTSSLGALRAFVSSSFDPRRSIILETPYLTSAHVSCAAAAASAGTATVVNRSINTLDVAIDATRPAWLVVAENWDEGWSARVDGRAVEVLPGNYTMRAARVPAGSHRVSFTYSPPGFGNGAVVSVVALVVTLVGLAAALFMGRRGPRVNPR
jgi:hypothetical protein